MFPCVFRLVVDDGRRLLDGKAEEDTDDAVTFVVLTVECDGGTGVVDIFEEDARVAEEDTVGEYITVFEPDKDAAVGTSLYGKERFWARAELRRDDEDVEELDDTVVGCGGGKYRAAEEELFTLSVEGGIGNVPNVDGKGLLNDKYVGKEGNDGEVTGSTPTPLFVVLLFPTAEEEDEEEEDKRTAGLVDNAETPNEEEEEGEPYTGSVEGGERKPLGLRSKEFVDTAVPIPEEEDDEEEGICVVVKGLPIDEDKEEDEEDKEC